MNLKRVISKLSLLVLSTVNLTIMSSVPAHAVTEADYTELISYENSVSYQSVTNSYRTYLNDDDGAHTYQYYTATANIDTGYFIDLSDYESVIIYSRNNGIGGHSGTQYTSMDLQFKTVTGDVLVSQSGTSTINGGTTMIYDTSSLSGMAHIEGSGVNKYYYCGSRYCNSCGWVYPQFRVLALGYQSPCITGDLTDKTMTEGVDDFIGPVIAKFPNGQEKYQWQYSDGDKWKNVSDGKGDYEISGHGTISITDINSGSDFSESSAIKIKNPMPELSGVKFRVMLISDDDSDSKTSSECQISVKNRDLEGFYSSRLASRYGQVGEKISTEDIISYVKFNNGQIVETDKLLESDVKRTGFYGFVEPEGVKDLSANDILSGLNDGTIGYTELGGDSSYLKIKEGENNFYLKLTYRGNTEKSAFTSVDFFGKDEMPPVFEENVELYEKDGMTLFTGGDYSISNTDTSDTLKICGEISDSVSESDKISWRYDYEGFGEKTQNENIPVYHTGSIIDIDVTKNGLYTIYAEDTSGNIAQKTITVRAFDEHDPVMDVTVNGVSGGGVSKVYSSYTINIDAEDEEKLSSKPYFCKFFSSESDAEAYNISNAAENDFSKINTYTADKEGYYIVAVRDSVSRTVSQIIEIPKTGETLDIKSPQIVLSPVDIKDSSGKITEYEILMSDDKGIKDFNVITEDGKSVVSKSHDHTDSCKEGCCSENYHFIPKEAGNFVITVTDIAGNKAEMTVSAKERNIEAIEVTDLAETMAVNSVVGLESLIKGNRILLRMDDGTTEIYSDQTGVKLELIDKDGKQTDEIRISYGENRYTFRITVNNGTENEKVISLDKTITGEDNVAPLPGQLKADLTEGWDGSLTNDDAKQITLHADGCEDDGSIKDKLVIVWYKDETEVQRKTVEEGGDTYGPFSGEDTNGTYRYVVIDEKGNEGFSTSSKVIDCYDMTLPTGEVKLLPEGTTCDSKSRYKQIQIINAQDNRGLAEKPYSFKGNNEENYTVLSSVVAGENGSFSVYLKDAAGNAAHLEDITFSGIDSIAPTINGYEIRDGENGEKILHIDAQDNDADGNDKTDSVKYSIDGESYQESPDFIIDESGNYTIYVKDDTGNITKTGTDYTDTDPPVITAMQEESGKGTIIVKVSDNVGLSRAVMEGPDGSREILQVYDGSSEDTIRKDIGKTGNYIVTVTDMAGNTADAEVNVSSIAPACSEQILSGLKITPSEWTSGDVTVIAQLTDTEGLSAAPFKWNGSIPTSLAYMIMTDNGKAFVEICDKYGNTIASQSVDITNIDRISPVMQELKQSEDKNHLIINVSDKGSGIYQITISGGPYTVETGAVTLEGDTDPEQIQITLPTNGTYTVRAYDRAGNSCQRQITAEGVTTDVVKVEYREVEKTVTADNDSSSDGSAETVYVTQEVEKAVPILVPVPTTETVTRYKTMRENGEDTSSLINGKDSGTSYSEGNDTTEGSDNETVRSEEQKNTISTAENREISMVGERTADGTYLAPDGFEYFNRVDPDLKEDHPFKYWFKKNAEKIAIAACILALIFLILCVVMGVMLTEDYFKEQKEKNAMKRINRALK